MTSTQWIIPNYSSQLLCVDFIHLHIHLHASNNKTNIMVPKIYLV